jgi:hypothetical protein
MSFTGRKSTRPQTSAFPGFRYAPNDSEDPQSKQYPQPDGFTPPHQPNEQHYTPWGNQHLLGQQSRTFMEQPNRMLDEENVMGDACIPSSRNSLQPPVQQHADPVLTDPHNHVYSNCPPPDIQFATPSNSAPLDAGEEAEGTVGIMSLLSNARSLLASRRSVGRTFCRRR